MTINFRFSFNDEMNLLMDCIFKDNLIVSLKTYHERSVIIRRIFGWVLSIFFHWLGEIFDAHAELVYVNIGHM